MREKIIATLLTAIMTMASLVVPALAAYDLGDYPGFLFDTDQNLQAYVVVGADAKPADVVGAVDLAVRLAGESYKEVTCGGAAAEGVETEDVPFHTNISSGTLLKSQIKHYDVPGVLKDDTIDFTDKTGSSDTYDYQEIVYITNSEYQRIETSSRKNKDFEDEPALFLMNGGLKYCFKFDEKIHLNSTYLDEDYPLEIPFLGQTLTITNADSSSITVTTGKEYYMNIDDSVTVAGHTVTLKNVGSTCDASGGVIVDIDGETKTIGTTTKTISGIKIKAKSCFYVETKEERSATLVIGEEISKKYLDNDPYCLHLSGSEADDCKKERAGHPDWRWDLSNIAPTSEKPLICVDNAQTLNDPDDNPPGPGDAFVFPHDYIQLSFDGIIDHSMGTYNFEYKDGVDLSNAAGPTSGKTLKIWSTSISDPLYLVSGGVYTDSIYLYVNDSSNQAYVFYEDENNKIQYEAYVGGGTNFADVTYQDTTMHLYWYNNTGGTESNLTVTEVISTGIPAAGSYWMEVLTGGTSGITGLDATTNKADGNEIVVYGTGMGTRDEDVRTDYGAIIQAPKSNANSDKVVIDVPSTQLKGTLTVGPVGEVTTTGETVKKVVPITNAVAKLDTEVSLPVSKHLVLVGGPAVNRLTAQAMGYTYPTYGADLTEFGEGEAYIKVYEDVLEDGYVAVVVAGWEATDTRNAASVLQQYSTFADELDGNVAVKVTSVTAAGITAAE